MIHIDEMLEFFEIHEDFNFTELKPIELSQGETIVGLGDFLSNHINILKHNSGNERYLPYYDRLYKVYLITKI